jgi:signal transduction histidine kinase
MNMRKQGRLLIVDDESAQMRALCDTLFIEGYSTKGFDSPKAALEDLRPGQYDLLLTDLQMPAMDGIALIAAVRQVDPEIGAIVMTGHGTIDNAVAAMRSGALDYITKPFRLNVVSTVIARALDLLRLRRENAALLDQDKHRAAELAAAYEDLESFSFSVSHDLRAPLLFVMDFARRLEEDFAEQLGVEGRRLAKVISDGSRNMDEMVVALLEFSRATRMTLQLAQVDMTPMVNAAIAEARIAYPKPAWQVDVDPLPAAAADATVIRHVWSNLIGNAFKYSSRREAPRIHIGGRIEGEEAIYSVEDNGTGFDMRYADRLFGVFKRLHDAEDFPGTGVGLAIASRILARHGGRIWAESTPDVGSRFQFALPLKVRDHAFALHRP